MCERPPTTAIVAGPDGCRGSACAELAALLTLMTPGEIVQLRFEIEQGVEMGRPSLLVASATKTVDGTMEATVVGRCVQQKAARAPSICKNYSLYTPGAGDLWRVTEGDSPNMNLY